MLSASAPDIIDISSQHYRRGHNTIVKWLVFCVPKFEMTKWAYARVANTVKRFIRVKQMYISVLARRQRLSTLTMMKTVNQTVYQGWKHGAMCWDLVIQRCLLVMLLFATGARIGDICVANGYTDGKCLTWERIYIQLAPGATTLDGAIIRICLNLSLIHI